MCLDALLICCMDCVCTVLTVLDRMSHAWISIARGNANEKFIEMAYA